MVRSLLLLTLTALATAICARDANAAVISQTVSWDLSQTFILPGPGTYANTSNVSALVQINLFNPSLGTLQDVQWAGSQFDNIFSYYASTNSHGDFLG